MSPIRSFEPAVDFRNAWASVLDPTKLTPRMLALTIRSTALLPPPHADDPDGPGLRPADAPNPAGDQEQDAEEHEDGDANRDDDRDLAWAGHRIESRLPNKPLPTKSVPRRMTPLGGAPRSGPLQAPNDGRRGSGPGIA